MSFVTRLRGLNEEDEDEEAAGVVDAVAPTA
jgi:hypothetical protein